MFHAGNFHQLFIIISSSKGSYFEKTMSLHFYLIVSFILNIQFIYFKSLKFLFFKSRNMLTKINQKKVKRKKEFCNVFSLFFQEKLCTSRDLNLSRILTRPQQISSRSDLVVPGFLYLLTFYIILIAYTCKRVRVYRSQ